MVERCVGLVDDWLIGKSYLLITHLIIQALFYFLFSFQGQLLALLLFIEIQIVARPDSLFKLSKSLTLFFASGFILGNSAPLLLTVFFSHTSRSETIDYVIRSLPYHQFLLRYPFLWVLPSKKIYICLLVSIFGSVGVIILSIMIAYILVLYELERQVITMSKKTASAHKQLIDEVMLHVSHSFSTIFFMT